MFSDKSVVLELDCAVGIILLADPDRLSQVMINLLTNALKATRKNGKVEIKAEVKRVGHTRQVQRSRSCK